MARLSGRLAPPPIVTWRAGRDGVGHAYAPRGRQPALCRAPWLDERLAWPVRTKHDACLAELDRLTRAALRGPAAIELGL